MSILTPDRQTDSRDRQILAAALAVFARYGFRRATMSDIATEAGLSRPLLYRSFAGKTQVYRAVAQALADELAEAGEAAWPPGLAVADGLPALAQAQFAPLHRLLRGSAHGAELMEAGAGTLATLHVAMMDRLERFVTARLTAAGLGEPDRLGRMLVAALQGFKQTAGSPEELVDQAGMLGRLAQAAPARDCPAGPAVRPD